MSQPGGAAGPPSSYQTNVNRAKTKKWVEAKSYSYDGDDWGEVDDYDEYGGYDEPEPEPAPRPTGLRQRGQSASKTPQETYGPREDLYQSTVDSRQPYGNTGGPPQQQYGGRSFMSPQSQRPLAMVRTDSFDRGDERRAFSAGGQQPPMGSSISGPYPTSQPQVQNTAAQDFQPGHMYPNQQGHAQQSAARPPLQIPNRSSMEARGRYGEYPQSAGGSNRGVAYSEQQHLQNTGSRAQSMTSNISSLDIHNRRDFSPSAMPPPLQTRGSPSPQGNSDSRSSSRHPPRKSSMNQDNPPNLPFLPQAPSMPAANDDLPAARNRSGSNASNPPALIRPADIYRRMQEEKEKERQSQESLRPDMDTILGRPNERPALGKPQESENNQRLKPSLDPVTERKSEYGMEGINVSDQTPPGEKRSTTSKKFELPKRAPDTYSQASRSSSGPMLPDVSRMSGFGESFGQSFLGGDDFGETSSVPMSNSDETFSAPSTQKPIQTVPEKDLRNQPSLGFTSAVHQAFDKAEAQVPPTPNSANGSTVGRSTSGGTSTVSPIISRGPSTATENWNSRLRGIDDVSTPTIAEGFEGSSSRPLSSESLGTPKQITRKPSPSLGMPPVQMDKPPSSFIPGHRRDLSTPSPDNSPARIPAVESNRQLRQPQEVEIAAATPTDPDFSTGSSSQDSDVAPEVSPDYGQPSQARYRDSNGRNMDMQPGTRNLPGKVDQIISPISTRGRTDSSSSSRVRNLADKFESGSRPGSAHSTTPRASILGPNVQKKEEFAPPRPLVDRNESFRPHLPGGWESSASIAPAVGLHRLETGSSQEQSETTRRAVTPTLNSPNKLKEPIDSMADQQPSSVSQIKDASEEAFTAVAAAGTALAGAFATAIGMEHHDSPTGSTAETISDEQHSLRKSQNRGPEIQDNNVAANTVLHPEVSRPFAPNLTGDGMSSTAPIPLPEPLHPKSAASPVSPEYFPSSPSRDQVSDNHEGLSEERKGAKQTPALPLLSTDARPHEYESDRLRKEIVRELTPMSASEPTTAETDYSNYNNVSRLSTSPSVRPGHESGVLPREYESYWNDANSDDETSEFGGETGQVENATTAHHQQGAAVVSEPLHTSIEKQPASSGPVVSDELSQDRPHMLPHRFSWEQPLQNIASVPEPVQEKPAGLTSMSLKSAVYPEGRSFQPQQGSSDAKETFIAPTTTEPTLNEPPVLPEKDLPKPTSGDVSGPERELVDDDKELPGYPPGLEVAPSVPEKGFNEPQPSGYAGSLESISQRSPIFQSEQRAESEAPLPEPPRQTAAPQFDIPPSPPPPNAQPKIPAFREILALKTPAERIRGYDSARDQFAVMDTGLARWLAATANDLPEHADLLTISGRIAPSFQGHKPSPSRSKLGGLLPIQSTASDGAALGAPIGGGSLQGLSPSSGSGGKISSQQVQAKGKDLLHTAGVFGGKANIAAKGLFSKGKSKLRAASGTEKATNLLTPHPETLSRGMQHLQYQPEAPPIQRSDSIKAVPQAAPPEAQNSLQSSDLNSPRDTPSLGSFTPSNEGDDERSEDSVPSNQVLPPRLSSLHDTTNKKEKESVIQPVTFGDSAPIFLRETLTADSYIGSPNEITTPRSATSSNKTPTQSNFKEFGQPVTSRSPRDNVETTDLRCGAREEVRSSDAAEPYPRSLSSSQSRFSTQLPRDNNVATPRSSPVPEQDNPQRFSEESKDTFHTADSVRATDDPPLLSQDQPHPQTTEIDRLMSRAPARLSALRQSEVSKPSSLQFSKDTYNPSEGSSYTRRVQSIHTPQRALRPSQDYSVRAPSIDSLPSPVSPYHSPPPITPTQSTVRERLEQREREGPVHYGIDHDFVPESDRQRARSRSPSYTNLSQNRPSQDSRPSYEPNIDDHPAFQKSEDIDEGSRRRSASKPRSRRGSRSSAFFRALGKSSDADPPPLPNAPDSEASSTPINTPTTFDKKRKSMSIFRSLTGNSGNGSGSLQSKENVTPTAVPTQPQHVRTEPIAPQRVEDDEFPMRDTQSKWSKRLQRASTSVDTQDSGKKKRFSAIGKRQSSSNNTQVPFQQPYPAQRQQPHQYTTTSPSGPSQPVYGPPTAEYSAPPPGGYYAPGGADIDPRVEDASPSSDSRSQQDRRPSSRTTESPAYVQNSSLRQQASPTEKRRKGSTARSSTAFSHRSPQHSSSIVPQSSSIRQVSSRESRSERSNYESQPSGSSWTRFSTRARSKSRSSQPAQPPLNGLTSPHPNTYEYAPASTSTEMFRRSFHKADRSDSPPPPPPPPKDDWHKPRLRDSSSGGHYQTPSQPSTRPLSSTQNRQSLSPLQTNVPSNRNSAVKSGKTLTPEEQRESRRLEIERSTLSPAAAAAFAASQVPGHVREDQDEHIQMSATSFPGQLWQPEYAHWDGD